MRISDWSSDVCSSDLPARRDADADGIAAVMAAIVGEAGAVHHRLPGAVDLARQRARAQGVQHGGKGIAAERRHRRRPLRQAADVDQRSEEHTSELQSLMRISSAVFCLKKTTSTTKADKTTRYI